MRKIVLKIAKTTKIKVWRERGGDVTPFVPFVPPDDVEYQTISPPLVMNKDNFDFPYNRYGHYGNMSIYLVGTEDITHKNLNASNNV